MSVVCSATTAAGKPCTWRTHAPSGLCINHDPARTDERNQLRREAGIRGKKVQMERALVEQVKSVSLRSVADLFPHLERALVEVINSGALAVDKSREIRGIVAAAAELLKANALAEENGELRDLLLEHHPELRKHLRAVR